MHYKNGREAQIGDRIVTMDYNGNPHAGVVIATLPGADRCNLQVIPITAVSTYSACECLHVEDALADPPKKPEADG